SCDHRDLAHVANERTSEKNLRTAGSMVEPDRHFFGEPGRGRPGAAPADHVSDPGGPQPVPGGVCGAALALLIGLIALVQIWHNGYAGAGGAAIGILLPLLMAIWPLAYLQAYRNMPALNDVTTDLASPPRFTVLAKQRVESNNGPVYPTARFAELQQKSYPDLRTFVIDRPVEETFELVEETAARLKWKVVLADAPVGKTAKGGLLEAIDQTLVMGFTDDIVVRVEGNLNRSRVDVRSASRYGAVDLGQNATRLRRFLAELKARS